jgi:predicted CopG family antitoxin
MKTKKITVTMPVDVIEKAKKAAKEDGRSFSNLVAHLVTEGIKNKAA